jgi:type IV pilus assembly protein PilA
MRSTHSSGFTLIELMIVTAIIGILASIAIPAYQEYIARAQASEALQLLSGAKTPLAEYYADMGHWPDNATQLGLNIGGNYVVAGVELIGAGGSQVNITLRATFRSAGVAKAIQNKKMVFETHNGGAKWNCGTDTGPDGIEVRYLPSSCR